MRMYACENWVFNRTDRMKTETTEMKFLWQVPEYILHDYAYSIQFTTMQYDS